MIRHDDGTLSKYIHIDKVTVKRDDKVSKGQQFAVTALNGPAGLNTTMRVNYPHLHLEIMRNDMKTIHGLNRIELDISACVAGLYLIHITDSQGNSSVNKIAVK